MAINWQLIHVDIFENKAVMYFYLFIKDIYPLKIVRAAVHV